MKQKIFKFPTSKQLRKRSESSSCQSSQEEALHANVIPADTCHKCKVAFKDDRERDRGMSMVCTFDICPYNHRPIHRQCFTDLEKQNYTFLKHCGKKTAKWTESKIWKCMWKRAGLRLLKRQLRCPCNNGFMCRDEDAYYEMMKVEDEDSYTSDSEEPLEDELPPIEAIKISFEDTKKALDQQSFDPFDHSLPESEFADCDTDESDDIQPLKISEPTFVVVPQPNEHPGDTPAADDKKCYRVYQKNAQSIFTKFSI